MNWYLAYCPVSWANHFFISSIVFVKSTAVTPNFVRTIPTDFNCILPNVKIPIPTRVIYIIGSYQRYRCYRNLSSPKNSLDNLSIWHPLYPNNFLLVSFPYMLNNIRLECICKWVTVLYGAVYVSSDLKISRNTRIQLDGFLSVNHYLQKLNVVYITITIDTDAKYVAIQCNRTPVPTTFSHGGLSFTNSVISRVRVSANSSKHSW